MIKKNLIKLLLLLFFISSCGYSPIYSNKNSNFSISQLSTSGNNKLNRIIRGKLATFEDFNAAKHLTVKINTSLEKKVSSKDTKGNPKTYRINLRSDIKVQDSKGKEKNKLFLKSVDYNNKNNKFDLKKFENQTSKILAEKIADELIIYLQSF
tara:strand:- start:1058 stop:1516 length:459 start_codon:yes stop_codon:yes gene_type:complete